MQVGRVVGRATATIKHPSMNGWRLLIVQPLDAKGGPDGEPQLAIDSLGAGIGDDVMFTTDGSEVRNWVGSNNTPIRYAVIGLPD